MRLEFLEQGAASCPLVRIHGTVRREFLVLRSATEGLAAGARQSCTVDALPGFFPVAGCSLAMIAAGTDDGVVRCGRQPGFAWRLTRRAWSDVAGLLDPFVDDACTGTFQWLAGPQACPGLDAGTIGVLLSGSADGRW